MEWILIALQWYLTIFLIGIVFYPVTKKLLGEFLFDKGYAFSKIVGILFLSYATFLLGILKILPFYQSSLIGLLGISALVNFFIFKKEKHPKRENVFPYHFITIIFEEVLFLSTFMFWVYVRGQEPSIHGLEKFMDFGFINSILRAKYFPPLDMWLSADPTHSTGYPINYYYFGHLTGAFLIRLTNIKPEIGYNLILDTLFALGVTQTFSFVGNIVRIYFNSIKRPVETVFNYISILFFALLGSFILNLGGNLHTIYLFTTGYENDKVVPFWQILGGYHPEKYWYPNATRFIPFTIHEFPSYSYVVADLHGHVFDIPFVLLTLAFMLLFVMYVLQNKQKIKFQLSLNRVLLSTIFLGFMCAVQFTTNAFDGPIYLLLTVLLLFLLFQFSSTFFALSGTVAVSFFVFSRPFSSFFSSFVSKIGANCSPDFLVNIGHLGPFLFEKNNCQSSPLWMMFVLWGFFWISAILFFIVVYWEMRKELETQNNKIVTRNILDLFVLILFLFGTFLIVIPEFFYAKDIYPAHFRANTMFKLGYQAFIMMSIASIYTLVRIKYAQIHIAFKIVLQLIFLFFLFFVIIYPFFAIPSYYGTGVDLLSRLMGKNTLNQKNVELDGLQWLETTYPENREIIQYFNTHVTGQPIILEAQGDSYTDYDQISAFTGLPTVAGWWVHQWLWRGSSDVVGKRIPDIINLYESENLETTKLLIKKYHISYIVVSTMEKQKYTRLNEDKFYQVGKVVFTSANGKGKIFQIKI